MYSSEILKIDLYFVIDGKGTLFIFDKRLFENCLSLWQVIWYFTKIYIVPGYK